MSSTELLKSSKELLMSSRGFHRASMGLLSSFHGALVKRLKWNNTRYSFAVSHPSTNYVTKILKWFVIKVFYYIDLLSKIYRNLSELSNLSDLSELSNLSEIIVFIGIIGFIGIYRIYRNLSFLSELSNSENLSKTIRE